MSIMNFRANHELSFIAYLYEQKNGPRIKDSEENTSCCGLNLFSRGSTFRSQNMSIRSSMAAKTYAFWRPKVVQLELRLHPP